MDGSGQTLQVLGKCLDAPSNAAAGAKVQLWDCNGGTNQQWTFNSQRDDQWHRSPGCAWTSNGNATANGTTGDPVDLHRAANQRWTRR